MTLSEEIQSEDFNTKIADPLFKQSLLNELRFAEKWRPRIEPVAIIMYIIIACFIVIASSLSLDCILDFKDRSFIPLFLSITFLLVVIMSIYRRWDRNDLWAKWFSSSRNLVLFLQTVSILSLGSLGLINNWNQFVNLVLGKQSVGFAIEITDGNGRGASAQSIAFKKDNQEFEVTKVEYGDSMVIGEVIIPNEHLSSFIQVEATGTVPRGEADGNDQVGVVNGKIKDQLMLKAKQ